MNQQVYIRRIAKMFGVHNCKGVHSSADRSSKLDKVPDGEVSVPTFPYRELVGALTYVARCTRPDIAFAVGEVATFVSDMRNCIGPLPRRFSINKDEPRSQHLFCSSSKGELIGLPTRIGRVMSTPGAPQQNMSSS